METRCRGGQTAMRDDQMGFRVDCALDIVADEPASAGAGRHGAGIRIGRGNQAVRRLRVPTIENLVLVGNVSVLACSCTAAAGRMMPWISAGKLVDKANS